MRKKLHFVLNSQIFVLSFVKSPRDVTHKLFNELNHYHLKHKMSTGYYSTCIGYYLFNHRQTELFVVCVVFPCPHRKTAFECAYDLVRVRPCLYTSFYGVFAFVGRHYLQLLDAPPSWMQLHARLAGVGSTKNKTDVLFLVAQSSPSSKRVPVFRIIIYAENHESWV